MSRLIEPGSPQSSRIHCCLRFKAGGSFCKKACCCKAALRVGRPRRITCTPSMLSLSRISEVGRRPLPHDLAVKTLVALMLSIGNGSTSVTVAHRKRHGLSWQSQVGIQLAVIPLLVAHRNRPAHMIPSVLGCMSSTWTKSPFKPIET